MACSWSEDFVRWGLFPSPFHSLSPFSSSLSPPPRDVHFVAPKIFICCSVVCGEINSRGDGGVDKGVHLPTISHSFFSPYFYIGEEKKGSRGRGKKKAGVGIQSEIRHSAVVGCAALSDRDVAKYGMWDSYSFFISFRNYSSPFFFLPPHAKLRNVVVCVEMLPGLPQFSLFRRSLGKKKKK
jgi:hypothetical protein